jgi:hypothetical protein
LANQIRESLPFLGDFRCDLPLRGKLKGALGLIDRYIVGDAIDDDRIDRRLDGPATPSVCISWIFDAKEVAEAPESR